MFQTDKIKSIEEVAEIIESLKVKGKRIVLCHGCFDLLHIGHIRYLSQSKQYGDVLVVTITPDIYVDKGPHRPAFGENYRAEAVASLGSVDYVAINKWPTAEETLRLLRPHVYVKGSDFRSASSDMTGKLTKEEKVVQEIGAELVFTDDVVFSSTNLINRFLSGFSDEIKEYLSILQTRYSLEYVLGCIDQMSSIKALVIGDAILDEYHYCHTLGTSSKDPALALHYISSDLFAGGAIAVANHVANFAEEVRFISVLGEKDSYEDFIRSKLHANVSPYFAIQNGAPTIIKRRFVEGYFLSKLFEVYVMDDRGLSAEKDAMVCDLLQKELPRYHLVLTADFGHGAISDNMRRILADHAPFLAVNTQANAGNRGFHTISRYGRADYVSISEGEIRLEFRDNRNDIKEMMHHVSEKLGSRYIAVTQGRKGSIVRSRDGQFMLIPAFAAKVIDRVGSGDAFFSITSLGAYLNFPPEIIGFIGNVVGALAVEILGNQKPIDKLSVKNYVKSLLK